MSEEEQPKTYNYKLDAKNFVKLFLASDEEFDEIKADMLKAGLLGVKGIERRLLNENDDFPVYLSREYRYTIINETDIFNDIHIIGIEKAECNHLLCINSKFRNIFIENSKLLNFEGYAFANYYFNNCTFGSIFLNNSTIGKLTLFNSGMKDVKLHNSTIEDFEVDNCILGLLRFINSITKDFILNRSNIKDLSSNNSTIANIYIDNNSCTGNLSIYNNSILGNIDIDNNSKTGFFNIARSVLGEFRIDNDSTIGYFKLNESTSGNFRTDNNCTIDLLEINESTTGNYFINNSNLGEFYGQNMYNSFYILASNIPILNLTNCSIPKFTVALTCKLEAYITGGKINIVDFTKTTLSKETIISFSGTEIFALLLDEFSMLGNLYFRQIRMLNNLFAWYIFEDRYTPLSNEEINENPSLKKLNEKRNKLYKQQEKYYEISCSQTIKKCIMPTIRISQSSLGKTEFTDCSLADFNFEFNNSRIIDCFISGGSVPGDNLEIIDPISKEIIKGFEEHKQKASFYNQLKKIFEAQGDIYNATIFQAKWAKHQEEYLKLKRKEENGSSAKRFSVKRFKSLLNENSQDIYILWLNKTSNNHGESWIRALGWLGGSSIILYILFIWSIIRGNFLKYFISDSINNYLGFNNPTITINFTFNDKFKAINEVGWNIFSPYLEFLNPIHKNDFLLNLGNPNFPTAIIDFIAKILSAFFLYKFLSAFRKHGKK